EPCDRVVITEDTVSRGVSMIEAARIVEEAGAEVILLLAVVDRRGAVAAVAEGAGRPMRAQVTAADLGFPIEGGAGPKRHATVGCKSQTTRFDSCPRRLQRSL